MQIAAANESALPEQTLLQPIVNMLAFSATFMPALWAHVARVCSAPLQVPVEAQQGLRFPLFTGGVAALSPRQVHMPDAALLHPAHAWKPSCRPAAVRAWALALACRL
jgi:hypothetical protein